MRDIEHNPDIIILNMFANVIVLTLVTVWYLLYSTFIYLMTLDYYFILWKTAEWGRYLATWATIEWTGYVFDQVVTEKEKSLKEDDNFIENFTKQHMLTFVYDHPDISEYINNYTIPAFRIAFSLKTSTRILSSARADVSASVWFVLEGSKLLLGKAKNFRNNPDAKEHDILDPVVKKYVVPFVERHPDATQYTYEYIIPSAQFTAIFQVGGVRIGLFIKDYYSKQREIIYRGILKATSSLFVILTKEAEKLDWTDGMPKVQNVTFGTFVVPFFKEPVVSACKVAFVDGSPLNRLIPIKFSQKYICNFIGETSHNIGKCLFGKQKLSFGELALSIPVKTLWKTGNQELEGKIVKYSCNPLGFYIATLIPRSWGNDFIEKQSITVFSFLEKSLNDTNPTTGSNHIENHSKKDLPAITEIHIKCFEVQDCYHPADVVGILCSFEIICLD